MKNQNLHQTQAEVLDDQDEKRRKLLGRALFIGAGVLIVLMCVLVATLLVNSVSY